MKSLPFQTIKRDDRVRINYGDIEELAESIYREGLIHPICITPDAELIAGGRRSAALDYIVDHAKSLFEDLGHPHDDIASFLHTGELIFGVHFTIKSIPDLSKLSELELVENVNRKSMTWQEETLSIAKIHFLKRQHAALDSSKWGQAETGRLFRIALGSVNTALFLARHLTDDTSPLWKCETATDAINLLTKQKHDEVSAALALKIKDRSSTLPTNLAPPTSSLISTFDLTSLSTVAGTPAYNPSDEYATPSTTPAPSLSSSEVEKDQREAFDVAMSMVHHCDAVEFFKRLGKESVDHVITDPPYGIDMNMLAQAGGGQQDIDRIADTHGVEENLADFPVWLEGCYDILKPQGFCVWFCDIMNFRYLHDLGKSLGFKVQRWPLHWVKTSVCMNQRAEFNFTKTVEHAIVFRKEGGRLVSAQSSNSWAGQLSSEDREEGVNHPFIKPRLLWEHLFKAIALPGSTIADPFSGVGSMPMAALRSGYQPVSCEIDEKHYAQQLTNLARVYSRIKGGQYDEILY